MGRRGDYCLLLGYSILGVKHLTPSYPTHGKEGRGAGSSNGEPIISRPELENASHAGQIVPLLYGENMTWSLRKRSVRRRAGSHKWIRACAKAPDITTVVVLYLRSLVGWRRRSCGRPFPPGPVCAPLVGNILTMPKVVPWAGLYELCKKYGQHILVLGSAGVAIEFLEKRSANTADRPWSPVTELSGQDLNPALMPYGPWWRQHRRVFWQHYYPGVLSEYRTLLRDETRKFLKRLAYTSPDERVTPHIRRMFCSIFLKLAYDIDVIDEHDQNVTRIEAAFKAIEVATPGHFAVDVFPFLRHLPAWFPGAGFQRTLALSKAASDHLKHELFASVIEALENNEDRNCMAANMLRTHAQSSRTPEEEEVMKNICAVSIEAGVDTSVTTLRIFFVAMAMYPDIQRKAQAELDAVVGADRLPDFSDMDLLVYVRALLKEIHRWHTVVPLSIPHRTMHDDVFHGYFIPAGTTAIPNVWAIMHDPETYENPDEFNPGRFIRDGKLDTTVCDPESFIFGFGRRICPGRHFANVALQIAIASLLHIFNIAAPVDEDGLPIHIEHTQEHGLLSRAKEYPYTLEPRKFDLLPLTASA